MDLVAIKMLLGNSYFDDAFSSSIGNLGGIFRIISPILIREMNIDYGLTPFRPFHSLFNLEGFDEMIEGTWKNLNTVDSNRMVNLMKKIQALKIAIKQWSKNAKTSSYKAKISIPSNLFEIDKIFDQGRSNEEILINRSLLKRLHDINSIDSLEVAQKSKVRWAIEEDENTKYFQGILNNKRYQLAIRGVLVDGNTNWIVGPFVVKGMFFKHFSTRFTNTLSLEQQDDLERIVSLDEIKRTVWDCGINKSTGPDGFTFEFFHRYWKVLEQDIVAVVVEFFASGTFPRGCNPSFIALIPKTQDSKFIIDFRPINLIGSLYKIIAKILANKLRFVISDLISDFQSAFVSKRQILDGFFLGIPIDNSLTISHLFFADDDIFLGFKINFHKSKLMEIGTRSEEVKATARTMSCTTFPTPFVHLGVKVGGTMSSIKSWEDVVSKVSFRLSKRKLKTLSIGASLWPRFIKAIYGESEALNSSISLSRRSPWLKILREDIWMDGSALKHQYPRLYALEMFKRMSLLGGLMSCPSRLMRLFGVCLDKLPPQLNLSIRGLDISSIICPLCNNSEESSSHLFFACPMARQLLRKVMPDGYFGRRLLCEVVLNLAFQELIAFCFWNQLEELFLNGVEGSDRKMAWISWNKVWRFFSQGSSLWPRFIKAIYGESGALNSSISLFRRSHWLKILREVDAFQSKGINLMSCIGKKVGNGLNSLFWEDIWMDRRMSLLGGLMSCPSRLMRLLGFRLDKLPPQLNLSMRGLDISSIICPLCNNLEESSSHLFFAGPMARQLLRKVMC
nr:RNA-directed DNA polymerase, eukaryota [Tanacetum cinerariifolium]